MHQKYLILASYQRRKKLQNYLILNFIFCRITLFKFLSTPQSAAELLFLCCLSAPQSTAEVLFWFLINAATCSELHFFLVSYQRQKTFQNYFFINLLSSAELFFLVPINAAKCFRITFLVCYQRCYQQLFFFNSLLSTVIFFVSFQRRKVLQNKLYVFFINAENCCRNWFFFISHQRSKVVQNYFFWFIINAAKCIRNT